MHLHLVRVFDNYRRKCRGLVMDNPVLCDGLALPFAVVCTTSLQNGVALSLLMAFSLIPTLMLVPVVGKKVPAWLHIVLFPLVASLLTMASVYLVLPISPNMGDSIGFYIYILCVNSLLLVSIPKCLALHKPTAVLKYAVLHTLGFALVVCLMSLCRELLGYGSLWGVPMNFIKFRTPGVLVPFFGFILLGFLGAAGRVFGRKLNAVLLVLGRLRAEDEGGNL